MSDYISQFVLPVPVLAVVPAGVEAAGLVSKGIHERTDQTLKIRGSWWRIIGYPVTIKLTVWGVDGAANVMLAGSSLGLGPIVGRVKRTEVEDYKAKLIAILMQWSANGAFATPSQASTPTT